MDKRKHANNMMVQIMLITLPDELLRYISTYVFYDINSNLYRENQLSSFYQQTMRQIIQEFTYCRKMCYVNERVHNIRFKINQHDFHGFHMYENMILSLCTRCGNYRSEVHFRIYCRCLL